MVTHFDELKQKARDTMETIADKSVELYKIAEEKTRLLAKITKLSAEITFEKGNVRKLYRELGKLYYDLYKSAPEPSFAQTCEEITASLDVISYKQKEIDELRGCADYESADNDDMGENDDDSAADVEIIVEDFEQSTPGNTIDSLKSFQDTDTLEEPEGDVGIDKTPPSFRL